jgi:hypothetical protein
MKKILIISLAILLISSAIESYALSAAVQAVCGVNSNPLTCTTSDDSEISHPVTQPGTSSDSTTWTAQKITLSATTRITAYKILLCDTGDTGSQTTALYSHDADNDKPASLVTGSDINVASTEFSACPTAAEYDFALDTPKEVSAGTYWIVNYEVDSAAKTVKYATSTGDRVCYSSNGSTWTCVDNTAYDMELWGCQ